MLFPFCVTPRLVAIAASGAVHAAVFASLGFTAPGKASHTAETILILETQEDVPPPPVVPPPVVPPPVASVSTEPLGAPRPPSRPLGTTLERPTAAPDFLARFMMTTIPPTAAIVPAAADEGGPDGIGDREGTDAAPMPETTYGEEEVSVPARLLSNVNATYPMEAWSSGLETDVPIEIVVDARGSVMSARVVTRAGHGFDEAALASIKSYRFAPAQRDGRAVRVRVRWSVQFRLRR